MKTETIVGIASAAALAAALALGTIEISPKAPAKKVAPVEAVAAIVGVRTDEMLAICREHYGAQSTVYERTPGRLACDTRTSALAKK